MPDTSAPCVASTAGIGALFIGAFIFFAATVYYEYLGRARFMGVYAASLLCSMIGIALWYHGMVRRTPIARLNLGKKLAFAGVLLIPIGSVPLAVYSKCGVCLQTASAAMIAWVAVGLPVYVLCCSPSGSRDLSDPDSDTADLIVLQTSSSSPRQQYRI